jgi:putative NIF3 family GTP cyclohydrolase 1 type 2
VTVEELIEQVLTAMGGPYRDSVDTLKFGDPSQTVTGVVATFMATVPVIRRAAELGANVIFTHEPTFYDALDDVSFLQGDVVYREKIALLRRTCIAVCRLHDHPHDLERPAEDPFFVGLVEAMGWEQYADPAVPYFCTVPPIRLAALVEQFKERLHLDSVRVLGDLDQECRRVILFLGGPAIRLHVNAFAQFDADVITVGECPEWETFSYVADANDLGVKRALVALGHQPSEEPGMSRLTAWLRERFPQIPVTHVPAAHRVAAM